MAAIESDLLEQLEALLKAGADLNLKKKDLTSAQNSYKTEIVEF